MALRIGFAVLLLLHGIAHGVGFAGSWQLGEFREAPLDTTLLAGRVDVGVVGIRAMGILWLLTGLAFAVAALGVWRSWEWWPPFTMGVVLLSLVMCILGWPAARIGVALNVAILVGLWMAGRLPIG